MRTKLYLISLLLASVLYVGIAFSQVHSTGSVGQPGHVIAESGLPLGGGTMSGPVAFNVCTQTANDTTPSISVIPGGCNILETSNANTDTGFGDITDLDDPLVGSIVYIVGTGGTYPTNIADSGNFSLTSAWVGTADALLILYVQADNDYVEAARSMTGGFAMSGDLDLDGYAEIIDQDGDSIWYNDRTSGVEDDTTKLKLGGNDVLSLDADSSTCYPIMEFRDAVYTCTGDCPAQTVAGNTLYSEGTAEFDASVRFDGTALFKDTSTFDSTVYSKIALLFNSSNDDGGIRKQADDGLHIFAGTTGNGNNNIIITSEGNRASDHNHDTHSPNPTLLGHSNADVTAYYGDDQWWSLDHDGTTAANSGDMRIRTGDGNIELDPAEDAVIPNSDNTVDLGASGLGWKDIYSSGKFIGTELEYSGNITIDAINAAADSTVYVLNSDGSYVADLNVEGDLTIGEKERCFTIPSQSAFLGPNAPTATTVGTFRGLAFDNDNEEVFLSMEISDDWVGGTSDDFAFKIYYMAEEGDAITDGETIKFDMDYRCIDFDNNEVIDNGNATSVTVTYTHSGAGVDKQSQESEITIDADDGDNSIVKGQVCSGLFTRDMTGDSYAGDAVIFRWEICYGSVGIPDHF